MPAVFLIASDYGHPFVWQPIEVCATSDTAADKIFQWSLFTPSDVMDCMHIFQYEVA
jgi:hypothetical protein